MLVVSRRGARVTLACSKDSKGCALGSVSVLARFDLKLSDMRPQYKDLMLGPDAGSGPA
jgi:hypothetical protein